MLQVFAILFPAICGIAISVFLNDDRLTDEGIKAERMKKRNRLYTAVILICDLLGILLVCTPQRDVSWDIVGGAGILLSPDSFGKLCLCVVLILYTAVCFYSFEYMKKEERHEYFFAFFFVSLGALQAVCLSGSLICLYAFFELATLSSMPLVLHEMTKESVAAGKKYLFYSIGGALMGLCAVLFVCSLTEGGAGFVEGGFMTSAMISGRESMFLAAAFLGILGFGTKAGIYPMHGWLPTAHPIAPAPASALMSGIIAKAGVIALVRLVYYSIGPSLLRGTWVQRGWMLLSMITILVGSSMAFLEKELKKRLAYSTVSQISYILLGLSLLSEEGLRGGLLQLMSHAASKGCLFLCAGAMIYLTGKRQVKDLRGIGKELPVTLWCFTLASLSLVGIPPMGGFIAKWTISGAALSEEMGVWSVAPVVVLLISAMLTAGYLLPIVIDGFFPGRDFAAQPRRKEPLYLTIPMLFLSGAALLVGILGGYMP